MRPLGIFPSKSDGRALPNMFSVLLLGSVSAFHVDFRPAAAGTRDSAVRTPCIRGGTIVASSAMQWEDIAGCKVLHPDKGTPPRGLVHFLGGLLVSPKPRTHVA